MTEKIKLDDFIEQFSSIISYSKRHMVKEDWCEWTESELVDLTFSEMEYYVIALSKCQEYMDMLVDYNNHGNKRESVFLDD